MSRKHPKLSPLERKKLFLKHLAVTCNVTKSAKLSGYDYAQAYKDKRKCPSFALAWEKAKKQAVESLEDEVHRRAFEGCETPTKYGNKTEYSDTLAIFLLKAHNPEKYKDRSQKELTGPGGTPLKLSDDKVIMKLDNILRDAKDRMSVVDQAGAIDVDFEDQTVMDVDALLIEEAIEDDFSDLA